MTMFFKRKEWHTGPWWGHVQKVQRLYARRLADRLNKKMAEVPFKRMRLYVVASLIGMAVLNGAMAVHFLGQHRSGLVSAASIIRRLQSVPPMKAWRFDDKLYDSLEKQRPGLADSLRMLEGLH